LYTQDLQWLVEAHRSLDEAVAEAYGWPADISEEDALGKLLEINLARPAANGPIVENGLEENGQSGNGEDEEL
jgi:hypothetical protein